MVDDIHTHTHTHTVNATKQAATRPECTNLVRCSGSTKPCQNAALGTFLHKETEEDSSSAVRPQVSPLVQHLNSAKQHCATWSEHPCPLPPTVSKDQTIGQVQRTEGQVYY